MRFISIGVMLISCLALLSGCAGMSNNTSEFGNNLLISCGNDAAIVFVLGNINSNKVHGHMDLPPEIIF